MIMLTFGGVSPKSYNFSNTSTCFYLSPDQAFLGEVAATWIVTALPTNQPLAHPKVLPSLKKVTVVDILTWELFCGGERLYSTPTALPYEFTNSNGLELPWGARSSSEQPSGPASYRSVSLCSPQKERRSAGWLLTGPSRCEVQGGWGRRRLVLLPSSSW